MSLTVAGSVLLAGDESLGVEEAPVCARSDLIDDVGLKVDIEGTRHMLARRGLGEERAETIVVGRGGPLDETTIGLSARVNTNARGKRVETHAQTVLNGVKFP